MNDDLYTDVLIVGGGPVGLSAAIELAFRSVDCLLINDRLQTAQHPKCNTTNSRSMEHFRRLGISQVLRGAGLPPNVERASSYVTRFCGHEFARLPRPYSNFPTPEVANQISQIVLEQELLAIAQKVTDDQIRFGCTLIKLNEEGADEYPINATVRDINGKEFSVNAKYLIGADGASSFVRKYLNISLFGEDGNEHRAFMGGTMLSYFIRAPQLQILSKRSPTHSIWIINSKMRGLMFSQDGKEKWVVHYQVPKGVDWNTLDPHLVIGDLLFPEDWPLSDRCNFEILSGGPWTGGLALVAEKYQSERIFLAGDAAHLFTPLGGMGMNTGIGDVMNLCWKISAHIQGWGHDSLLKSYEAERRPIGLRNSAFGVKCARVMDHWNAEPDFESENERAIQKRLSFGAQVMLDDAPQYLTAGLQLGEIYEESPVIVGDGSPAPVDQWDQYHANVRAGARAPHFWIKDGVSVFDVLGPWFTLINFKGEQAAAEFVSAAKISGIQLKVMHLNSSDTNGIYPEKLCLIRPDQHIAWVGNQQDFNSASRILNTVVGFIEG